MTTDPISMAELFAAVLEGLGVTYLVAGSVASTLHGEPRATLDVDFVTHLDPEHVAPLQEALGSDWYFDRVGGAAAAANGGLFNAIHLPTMVKVDVYARPRAGLSAEELRRAVRRRLASDATREVRVATPEDTILQELRGYEVGARASDRQWRDVLGIAKSVGRALDRACLMRWAPELGVAELVERALREAGT